MLRLPFFQQADASSPGSYPQPALGVGCDGTYGVMSQDALLLRVMGEGAAPFRFPIQSAFHGSHPQGALLILVDGIHGVVGQASRILFAVAVVRQGEPFGG